MPTIHIVIMQSSKVIMTSVVIPHSATSMTSMLSVTIERHSEQFDITMSLLAMTPMGNYDDTMNCDVTQKGFSLPLLTRHSSPGRAVIHKSIGKS
jgi:hypothetical protein